MGWRMFNCFDCRYDESEKSTSAKITSSAICLVSSATSRVVCCLLTSDDSYRCDCYCLARVFRNLPAPPKHYGVFDVLAGFQSFCELEKLGSHQAMCPDDRFLHQSDHIHTKLCQVRPMPKVAYIKPFSVLSWSQINWSDFCDVMSKLYQRLKINGMRIYNLRSHGDGELRETQFK